MSADRLLISDLLTSCRVGVTGWEQARPQPIWIDVELQVDAARAAATDDLQHAIDYAHLVTLVREAVQVKVYKLLETMAEEVAALILKEFHPPQVIVRVKKRALPDVGYTAVEVIRGFGR